MPKFIITFGQYFKSLDSDEFKQNLDFFMKKNVSIIRFNLSHYDNIQTITKDIESIVNYNKKSKQKFKIMLDTAGPEIRITNIDKPLKIKKDDVYTLTNNNSNNKNTIIINSNIDWNCIKNGTRVLINDAKLQAEVVYTSNKLIQIKFLNDDVLVNKKKVVFENTKINLPLLSEKDKQFIQLVDTLPIDIIALSFVSSVKDIHLLKDIIKNKKIEICCKIENAASVKNLSSIIKFSDYVMCARGDLSLEIGYMNVPIIQQKIANLCAKYNVKSIVATQLLESCCENNYPLRSEVSDITYSLRQGYDFLMLSAETSISFNAMNNVEILNNVVQTIKNSKLKMIK